MSVERPERPGSRFDRRRELAAAVVVVLASVAPFAGTLTHGFALDDVSEVVRNDYVRSLRNLPAIFRGGAWEGAGEQNPIYRPLTTVTYAINFAISGLAPLGFHATNLSLHALVSLLVLALARRLGLSRLSATFAAAVFAAHPAHVEVVANIAGRKDALTTGFAILTLLAHRAAIEKGRGWLLAPLVAFAAAVSSKETGAVALGFVVASDLFLERSTLGRARWRVVFLYVSYVVALGLFFGARQAAVGSLGVPLASIPFVENPLPHVDGWIRIGTAIAVLGRGFSLLVFPHALSPDYSWSAISLVESPFDGTFLSSGLLLGGLGALAVACWRARPVVTFLVLWYALAIFPASNLLVPVGTIFGERLLYLPSVGFCLAAGLVVQKFLAGGKLLPRVGAVAVVVLLAARTVAYAGVWASEVSLFSEAVRAQPASAKAHQLYGAALMEEDQVPEGTRELETAVRLLEGLPEPPHAQRIMLGVAYERGGRLPEAAALYERVLRQTPDYPDALWRLGVVRWREGQKNEAARLWKSALAAAPDHARAMTDLGLAALDSGDSRSAEALWIEASRLDPRIAGPWLSLGELYARRGDVPRARAAWQRFLELARYGVYPGQRELVEEQLRATDPAGARTR